LSESRQVECSKAVKHVASLRHSTNHFASSGTLLAGGHAFPPKALDNDSFASIALCRPVSTPQSCMQVGLRPRLRGRASLYDLIRQRNIDQLSVAPAKLAQELSIVDEASNVPLPSTPRLLTSLSVFPPTSSPVFEEAPTAPEELKPVVKMVPVSFTTCNRGVRLRSR
jgi:hypothetical protein